MQGYGGFMGFGFKNDKNVKSRSEAIENKLIYNLVTLTILVCTVVYILNIVVVNQVIYRIRSESIDYDLFREMHISNELIEEVINVEEISSRYDKYDLLTLYMLVYEYDTLELKEINKGNLDLFLRSLVYDENFRQIKSYYQTIFEDIEAFPVLQTSNNESNVRFEDTWQAYRSYGGDRGHEGTDLMSKDNLIAQLKIVSMTDGVVEQKGWLEQGGYRLGVRSNSGAYFYYAHLDSYPENLKVGDQVKSGDFLGYMGDSGYGEEGTTGQFDVHLHLGIYLDSKIGEISVNPYFILEYLQKNAKVPELALSKLP